MRIVFGIGIGFESDGKAIPDHIAHERIQSATRLACERFGGCFIVHGNGGWIDEGGKLIVEPGITLTVESDASQADASEFASILASLFRQSAVMVSVSPSAVAFVSSLENSNVPQGENATAEAN